MLHIAHALASQGRNGDSELLHVSKSEIAQLDQAAKARGLAGLPRNPTTGLHEASFMSDIGVDPNGINAGNALQFAGAAGGLFAGPVGWANTANYVANQGSRATGGSGSALQDAGAGKDVAGAANVGLQLASIYNMGATVAGPDSGLSTIGGTGTPWGTNPLGPTPATNGAGAGTDPSMAYNAGTPAANTQPMPQPSAQPWTPDSAVNAAPVHAPVSDQSIMAADQPDYAHTMQGVQKADALNATGGSTPWSKSDYLLAASLAGPAYGAIDAATNGKKDQGPSDHASNVLYSKAKMDKNGHMTGLYGGPSDYGTKVVHQTYAQGGGIRSFASGSGLTNLAGQGDKGLSNLATPMTSATAPSAIDAKKLPAGSDNWSDAAKNYWLAGQAAMQPQVDLRNSDAAAAAAADASHKNGNGGVMGEWGNALNNSGIAQGMAALDPMTFMFSSTASDPGKAVADLGKSFGFAQGGPVNQGGISSLPPAYLHGAGDAMSDSIPAYIDGQGKKPHEPIRVADGEYVVPGDAVSHLGNGSSNAGAKRLDKMVKGIRAARTGTVKQAPQVNVKKFLPA